MNYENKNSFSRIFWIWKLRLMNCGPVVGLGFECEKGTRGKNSYYFSVFLSRKETISPLAIVKRIF